MSGQDTFSFIHKGCRHVCAVVGIRIYVTIGSDPSNSETSHGFCKYFHLRSSHDGIYSRSPYEDMQQEYQGHGGNAG